MEIINLGGIINITLPTLILVVIVISLLIYLLFALFFPERFM